MARAPDPMSAGARAKYSPWPAEGHAHAQVTLRLRPFFTPGHRRPERQLDAEGRAHRHVARHAQDPAHEPHELATDGQAQPRASVGPRLRLIDLRELLEDRLVVALVDPDTRIDHVDPH